MDISLDRVHDVIKTLPITFYTKNNTIKVKCEDDCPHGTSRYNMVDNEIIVNTYQLMKALTERGTNENYESIIRSMFYHEVSHAILTPVTLGSGMYGSYGDAVNIFEDERIETIMRNYYYDVDFKRLLRVVAGDIKETSSNPVEAFFKAVRFGICNDANLLEEIRDLIKKYKDVDRTYDEDTDWYGVRYNDRYKTQGFREDIKELFDKFRDNFDELKDNRNSQSNGSGEGEGQKGESSDQNGEDDNQDKNGTESKSSGEGNEDEESKEGNSSKEDEPQDERSDKYGRTYSIGEDDLIDRTELGKKIEKIMNDKSREDISAQVRQIFAEKKNLDKRNGSAINAYSGVFDVRSVVREDYKFFLQKNRLGHQKMFSKIHLNLFIDNSGSFYRCKDIVNQLLSSLEDFEKENRDFTFDLVTMGRGEKLRSKDERRIDPEGGNRLDERIFKLYKDLQKPGTTNYNLVLFDGDALSDGGKAENFKAFDNSNTILISDDDNEEYINEYCNNKAKVIITKDYVNELIKNVFNTLRVLVR